MNKEYYLIIALLIFLILIIIGTYVLIYFKVKKFCEYHNLNFKEFLKDEITKGIDTSNPYFLEKYKIK